MEYNMENPEEIMELAEMLRHKRGEPQRAIKYYEEAYVLFLKDLNHNGMCRALNGMGMTNRKIGNYQKALELYQEAIDLFQGVHDIIGQAWVLNNMGNIYLREQQLSRAYACYKEAHSLFRMHHEKRGIGFTYGNMALVYLELGMLEEALNYATKSLEIHTSLKIKEEIAYQQITISEIYRQSKMYETAMRYVNMAMDITESLGHKERKAICWRVKGNIYQDMNSLIEAERHLNRAETILSEGMNNREYANCLLSIGRLHIKQKLYAPALNIFGQALSIYKRVNDAMGRFETYCEIGYTYQKQQKLQRAERSLQLAHMNLVLIVLAQKTHEIVENTKQYQKSIEFFHPTFMHLYHQLTDIMIQLKKYDLALVYHQIGVSLGWILQSLREPSKRSLAERMLHADSIRHWFPRRLNLLHHNFTGLAINIRTKDEPNDIFSSSLTKPIPYHIDVWVFNSTGVISFVTTPYESIVKLNGAIHLHLNNNRSIMRLHERKRLYNMILRPVEQYLPKDPSHPLVFVASHNFLKHVRYPSLYNEKTNLYCIEEHAMSITETIPQLIGFMVNHSTEEKDPSQALLLVGNTEYPNNVSHGVTSEVEFKSILKSFRETMNQSPGYCTGAFACCSSLIHELTYHSYKFIHFSTESKGSIIDPPSTVMLPVAYQDTYSHQFDISIRLSPSFTYEYVATLKQGNLFQETPSFGDKSIKLTSKKQLDATALERVPLQSTKIITLSPSQTSGNMISGARFFGSLGVSSVLFSQQSLPDFTGTNLINHFYEALLLGQQEGGIDTLPVAECYRQSILKSFKDDKKLRESVELWDAWTCFGCPFHLTLSR